MVESKPSQPTVTVLAAALVALSILAPSNAAPGNNPSNPGCGGGASPYPCLPGIDSIGIGYDIVHGSSFGVGSQVVQLSYDATNTWKDPFGNDTWYAYPNEATITAGSTQFLGHSVYRSVTEVAKQRSSSVREDFHAGFFSESAQVSWASGMMKDGMHIVAVSEAQMSIYTATLQIGTLLTPDPTFQKAVDMLPDQNTGGYQHYYDEFIEAYGTHYVKAAKFGGVAQMKTVITQDYYSTHSDSDIEANLRVAWGMFGGGAGGGTSSKSFSADWTSNAVSNTFLDGGDPAIRAFNSTAEWEAWARSVERGSPAIVQLAVDPIWYLIRNATKAQLVQESVLAYAAQYNVSWPGADPASYQMGWCDCYWAHGEIPPGSPPNCKLPDCPFTGCAKPGFFEVARAMVGMYSGNRPESEPDVWCCRPCFSVPV